MSITKASKKFKVPRSTLFAYKQDKNRPLSYQLPKINCLQVQKKNPWPFILDRWQGGCTHLLGQLLGQWFRKFYAKGMSR